MGKKVPSRSRILDPKTFSDPRASLCRMITATNEVFQRRVRQTKAVNAFHYVVSRNAPTVIIATSSTATTGHKRSCKRLSLSNRCNNFLDSLQQHRAFSMISLDSRKLTVTFHSHSLSLANCLLASSTSEEKLVVWRAMMKSYAEELLGTIHEKALSDNQCLYPQKQTFADIHSWAPSKRKTPGNCPGFCLH